MNSSRADSSHQPDDGLFQPIDESLLTVMRHAFDAEFRVLASQLGFAPNALSLRGVAEASDASGERWLRMNTEALTSWFSGWDGSVGDAELFARGFADHSAENYLL